MYFDCVCGENIDHDFQVVRVADGEDGGTRLYWRFALLSYIKNEAGDGRRYVPQFRRRSSFVVLILRQHSFRLRSLMLSGVVQKFRRAQFAICQEQGGLGSLQGLCSGRTTLF